MSKKIFILIFVIVLIIGLIGLLFFILRKDKIEPAKSGSPPRIFENNVTSLKSSGGSFIYYFDYKQKRIVRRNIVSRELMPASPEILDNVQKLIWAPRHDRSIILISNNPGINQPTSKLLLFDSQSRQELRELPRSVAGFIAWSPEADKIAYTRGDSADFESLFISNPDGTNVRELAKIPTAGNLITLHWSSNGAIYALRHKAGGDDLKSGIAEDFLKSVLFKIDVDSGQYNVADDLPAIADINFSPDGRSKIFYLDNDTVDTVVQNSLGDKKSLDINIPTLKGIYWADRTSVYLSGFSKNKDKREGTKISLYQISLTDLSVTEVGETVVPLLFPIIDNLVVYEKENLALVEIEDSLYSIALEKINK